MSDRRDGIGPSAPDGTSAGSRWQSAADMVLAGIAVLMLATVWDYGLVWDEELQSNYGEFVLNWFRSGFQNDYALYYKNLYLYGGFFDVLAQLFARLSPLGLYEDRHLVNIAFGLLALRGTNRLGTLLLGPRTGLLAMVLVALTPMFYGHSFNNAKDIPFAALFVWALCHLYESARALPAVSRWATTKLAISVGCLLAIRAGGMFFFGYILLLWSLALWRAGLAGRVAVRPAVTALALVVLVAWLIMLSLWPWGQVNPILNPLRSVKNAARFSHVGTTLFFGQQVPMRKAPVSYLPVWFGLQLPEMYFAGAVAGVAAYVFGRRRSTGDHRWRSLDYSRTGIELGFLAFVVLFPIAAAMILRSTLYDAVRHFLFVLPPLAVLAVAGIERGLRPPVPRAVRALIACGAIATAGLTTWDMIALHPYESVYFNRVFAGGLKGAAGRFETDYWGSSYREAVEWVVHNVPGEGIRIANCSYPLQSSYYLRGPSGARFIPVSAEAMPDLLLATTRWDCHRRPGARVLHKIERQGVPLVYVLDLRP